MSLATRRPAETGTAVSGLLAIVLLRVFGGDEELALAVAGLLCLLPGAITWAVELCRKRRPPTVNPAQGRLY